MQHFAAPSDMRNYTAQIPQLLVDIHPDDPPEVPGSVVLHPDRLQRPLQATRTILQRRTPGTLPQTAQVYAALHGCTIATARQILAGERLPPWLVARNRDAWGRDCEAPPRSETVLADSRSAKRGTRAKRQASVTNDGQSSIRSIIDHVCEEWEVQQDELLGSGRECQHIPPRHAAMALIAGLCQSLTHRAIGEIFGRCHSTVTCALRSHRRRLIADPDYAAAVARVVARLSIPRDGQRGNRRAARRGP